MWSSDALPYTDRPPLLAFAGGIAEMWGAREMVLALGIVPKYLEARLYLAGQWEVPELMTQLESEDGWSRVEYVGVISRDAVRDLFAHSRIGIVVLHPTLANLESQPTKLFEYIAAALHVVTKKFPLWKQIVEGCGSGLTVDP